MIAAGEDGKLLHVRKELQPELISDLKDKGNIIPMAELMREIETRLQSKGAANSL